MVGGGGGRDQQVFIIFRFKNKENVFGQLGENYEFQVSLV